MSSEACSAVTHIVENSLYTHICLAEITKTYTSYMALESLPRQHFLPNRACFFFLLCVCLCWEAFVAFCSGFGLTHKSHSWKHKEAQVKVRWIYHHGAESGVQFWMLLGAGRPVEHKCPGKCYCKFMSAEITSKKKQSLKLCSGFLHGGFHLIFKLWQQLEARLIRLRS